MVAAPPLLRATTILGRTVENELGERLGVVEDIVINLGSDGARVAIVKFGGALGVGASHVAVPMRDLKWSEADKTFSLATSTGQFRASSSIPAGGWLVLADQNWARKVDYYFGDPGRADQDRFARSDSMGSQENREFIRAPAEAKPSGESENGPGSAASSPLSRATDGEVLLKVTKLIDLYIGSNAGVEATVANGMVTLKGKVATSALKTDLETRIRAIDGVTTLSDEQLSATNE
jgi:hypothetical protein